MLKNFTYFSFITHIWLGIIALLFPTLACGQSTTAPVVISQVYPGGGNSGATYNRDFVELFNRSNNAVVITGWSIQYATSTGSFGGSNNSYTITDATIPAGGYFLVGFGVTGSSGIPYTTDQTLAVGSGLSSTVGKIALASNATTVTYTAPTSFSANTVDVVGYGSTANAYEGSGPAPAPANAVSALFRLSSGCTDTNNNSADFISGAVILRSSATTPAPCAAAPTITSFTPASGPVNSVVTITGTGLAGATAVRFNGLAAASFSATDATTVVATVAAGTTSGAISVITPSGTATSATSFTVTATPTTFYAKTSGALNLPASFGANTDGSGAAPINFTASNTSYVVSGTSRSLTADWVVSGTSSKVVLAANASLVIPVSFTYKGTLDQLANSTLVLQNTTVAAYGNITQGVQDASSTIDFAQAGDYTLPVLPTATGFGIQNLKLTGGTKRFARNASASTNGTVVPGNLTLDATVVAGATTTPFSSITLRGNLTLLNGASFATASAGKLTLALLSAAPQTLTGNGNDIILLELDALTAGGGAILSNAGGSTNLELGNSSSGGGGYYLETGSSLVLNDNTLRFAAGGNGFIYTGNAGVGKGTVTPSTTSSISLETTSTVIGNLLLTPGATTVQNFRLSCPSAELTVASDLTVNGLLTLADGRLAFTTGHTLTLNGSTVRTNGTIKGSATLNLVVGGTGPLGSLAFAPGFQQVNNFTLNRSASGTATLASPLTVGGTLTLTAGQLATDVTNVLTLPAAATVAGGSGSSFVSGPLVRLVGPVSSTTSYLFPVGKGAAYRPLTLTVNSQTSTTYYRAEQLEGRPTPATLASPDASGTDLARISRMRSFTLSPFASAPDASSVPTQPTGFVGTVKISFGADDGVTTPNDPGLVVAKRSDSTTPWVNAGNSGVTTTTTGPTTSGTITSGSITSFSDFTLGATNAATTSDNLNTINPLPIQLTSFAAFRRAGGVQVAWATASELGSARFVVERSADGRAFAAVASVAAQGYSTQAHTYATLDHTAPTAHLYYRLRQIDTDGAVAYSPTAAVAASQEDTPKLTLAPSPAHDYLALLIDQPTAYVVRTALGQAVLRGTTQAGSTTLAVAGLPAGVYLLELHSSAGRVVRRFVKE
ncbi:MAG: T9SS type A sorting domain-containing protein [Hymenobacter sp.]|nr:MAG: T9SS type A sorting domain-containing protein [Hymenobacter sp.]